LPTLFFVANFSISADRLPMIELAILAKFRASAAACTLLGAISTPLVAQTDCQQITADSERLACYDQRYPPLNPQESAQLKREPVAEDKPATEAAPLPAPEPLIEADVIASDQPAPATVDVVEADISAEERFGRETVEPKKPLNDIQSVIGAMIKQPRGHRQFTLENGQVWREIEVGRSQFRKGMPIEIVRTPFGSYLLKGSNGRRTKVRRVN